MKMGRNFILTVVGILFISLVLLKISSFFSPEIPTTDATRFVLEDLAAKYPGGETVIMNITPKYNSAGEPYYEIKTRLVKNSGSVACPERLHIFYNYPVQNFIPQPPEIITHDCRVCQEGLCTLLFKEEAVIASHTLPGTAKIKTFLENNPNASVNVSEHSSSWLVKWLRSDGFGLSVLLRNNGDILSVQSVEPEQK